MGTESLESTAETTNPIPQTNTAPTSSEPLQCLSETLFQGHRELLILHQGETYRLRITRSEKLILTK